MILIPCWSKTSIGKYSLFWFTFEKKIFSFFELFCVRSDSKLVKSAQWPHKYLFHNIFIWVSKNTEVDADLKSIEKSY